MRYFTSDIHFNDEPTLKVDARPFKFTKAFDNYIIKMWNKQAKKGDTIFVVGDFIDCDGAGHTAWQTAIKYVKKINADVILIMGNNEERVVKNFFNDNFNTFKDYCIGLGFKDVLWDAQISFAGYNFYLTHKPINHKKEYINLFGHIHRSTGIYRPFGFNIGCDCNHFRLYSEQDIVFLIEMRDKYWLKDKNVNVW